MKILYNWVLPSVSSRIEDASLSTDISKIEKSTWKKNENIFLDEARRLRDIETSRKNAAETKGHIYLTALIALIPLLITLSEKGMLKNVTDFSSWYDISIYLLFLMAIFYGVSAFSSSFRALNVKGYHRIDVLEISNAGDEDAPVEHLIREILKSVRLDRETINLKVSYILLTQALLLRMAALFIFILLTSKVLPKLGLVFEKLITLSCG